MEWNKITDTLYLYKVTKGGKDYVFKLAIQDIGVYGVGKSMVLWGNIFSDKAESIASLWIKDDGYKGYREKSHGSKLWSMEDAKAEISLMVKKIIINIY